MQETSADGERTDLRAPENELEYWKRKVTREQGKKPIIATFDPI